MKTQSILKTALCLAGFSVVALTGAQAQVLNPDSVINVQLGFAGPGNGSGTDMNGVGYTSTASPLAYVGNVWNEESAANGNGTASNLAYSDSTLGLSGIGYSAGALFAGDQYQGTNTLPLLENTTYNYIGVTSQTLTFTGLNNSLTYDIAIAAYSPGVGHADTFVLGSNTQTTTLTPQSTWVLDQNYVEFDNITPTSNAITITVQSADGQYEAINGFQIGATESAPEPSTVALIGLGALGLAFLVRRHRTA